MARCGGAGPLLLGAALALCPSCRGGLVVSATEPLPTDANVGMQNDNTIVHDSNVHDANLHSPGDDNVPTDANLPLPHITVVGRWLAVGSPPHLRFSWPGVAIGVSFRGTELSVDMQNASFLFKGSQLSTYFNVTVDGAAAPPFHLTTERQVMPVASGLADGEHTVWITKRTEAMLGATDFWGVSLGPGGTFLPPPPHLKRRVQGLGASDETGYGVGATNCGGFQDVNEDQDLAWPQLLAHQLNAELMHTAYAGKGLCWNLDPSNPGGPDPLLLAYDYADANASDVAWDHAWAPADVVVLDVGGVDFVGAGDLSTEPLSSRFRAGAVKLALRLVADHHSPWIYWAINSTQSDYVRQTMTTLFGQINTTLRGQGVSKLGIISMTPYTGFVTGCDGHPTAALHVSMAQEAAAQIRRDLSW